MTSDEKPRISPLVVGWREWVALPGLGIRRVKAKIDTGARSSSLHAIDVRKEVRDGKDWVRFRVHPLQRNSKKTVECEAEVLEYRSVKSSTGHASRRPVILTSIELHGKTWEIEVTLANRTEMGFRMLLGREGVRGRFLVDPGQSYFDAHHVPKRKKRTKAAPAKSSGPVATAAVPEPARPESASETLAEPPPQHETESP